jgi:hypothetical protein
VLKRATGNSDSQDSPRPRLGGSHHLPPYNILCASPQGPHPNGILSRDSQMGVPKLPKLRLPQLWGPITLRANLWLGWGLKQSFSPCRELFNGISHATWTQGNQVNFWLLVVGSQTTNLTIGPSFGHKLYFRCPNGSYEPILDIYVSISFQWYNFFFNPFGFDPCNCSLNIRESTGSPTPKVDAPLGVWGFHSLTLAFTSMLPLLACNLASPCLGCEPKARVATPIYETRIQCFKKHL